MSQNVIIAPGSDFQVNTGGGGSFVSLGEPVSIDNFDCLEYAKIKSTALLSTFRESVPGLPGFDDMTVKMHYTRAGYTAARALRGVQGKSYKVVLANGDNFTISGYIRKSDASVPEAEATDPDMFNVLLAVNSVTYANGP